ncbi:MAG: thioredoxin family protein [Proteobacteria bacterium]|nr:thioredoxin family protein [Pseudomonadota bacterium]
MKIHILGSGCQNCMKLAKNAEEAAKAKGTECEVIKITDIKEIMSYGVMQTPAIVIDGKVKSVGRVLSVEEIKKLL